MSRFVEAFSAIPGKPYGQILLALEALSTNARLPQSADSRTATGDGSGRGRLPEPNRIA
jgi:hypothetical protein